MLQKGVALILIHSLTYSGANIGQYCCIYKGGLVKDESHMSKPGLSFTGIPWSLGMFLVMVVISSFVRGSFFMFA